MKRGEAYEFGTEFLDRLAAATNMGEKGGIQASPWICINAQDGTIARAYPYKGEHRIVPILDDSKAMEDLLAFERDLPDGAQFS